MQQTYVIQKCGIKTHGATQASIIIINNILVVIIQKLQIVFQTSIRPPPSVYREFRTNRRHWYHWVGYIHTHRCQRAVFSHDIPGGRRPLTILIIIITFDQQQSVFNIIVRGTRATFCDFVNCQSVGFIRVTHET